MKSEAIQIGEGAKFGSEFAHGIKPKPEVNTFEYLVTGIVILAVISVIIVHINKREINLENYIRNHNLNK